MKKLKAKLALAAIAAREGRTLAEVERDIQAAINAAWSDPAAKAEQLRLFPDGKPTPAEFVAIVSTDIKNQQHSKFIC